MPVIVRHGELDDGKFPYGGEEFTCGSCGCIFRLVRGDKWSKKDGGTICWMETTCPDCGRLVSTDGPENPRHWARVPE